MTQTTRLAHLEWQALLVLYRHRERESSPMRLVGFRPAISGLMRHDPPLAAWVGKPSEYQVHITDEGIAYYKDPPERALTGDPVPVQPSATE